MRGLSSILSLFPNEFNNFNNTGARMLVSIYHIMTLKLIKNRTFGLKRSIFLHLTQHYNGCLHVTLQNL